MVIGYEPNSCFKPLVRLLGLSVSSGVICCQGIMFYPRDLTDFLHEFRDKSRVSVAYNLSQ
jgi:hypothetical protein